MRDSVKGKFDFIVVGGGVIGASVFYHLVNVGYKVCLLEKNTISSGCTSWSGGIVRCFHLERALSEKAIYGWNYFSEFEKNTGIPCKFVKSGFMYFPQEKNVQFAQQEIQHLSQYISIEWLTSEKLKKHYGQILSSTDYGAVYEPHSGYLDPVAVTQAWLHAAQCKGGVIYEHSEIKNFIYTDGMISGVVSSAGTFLTSGVVMALGPYTPMVLDQLGISHDVYAQVIQVDIRKPMVLDKHQPAYIDDCNQLNGRADPASGSVYIGYPTNLRLNTFSDFKTMDPMHSEVIRQQGVKRWKWVEKSELVRTLRSADCYTADGLGRVMALDNTNRIFIASGFSGGGFKMAPWIGNEILQLVKKVF